MSRRSRIGLLGAVLASAALGLAAPAGAAGVTLTVKSVPQLQGLDFVFAGHRYTTGKDGTVAIPVAAPGTYRLQALPWRHLNRGLKVSFSRWADSTFTPTRTVKVRGSTTLEVGYGVSYLRGLRFYDCIGADNNNAASDHCDSRGKRSVSPKDLTTVTIANIVGSKFIFHKGERKWLEGARVSRGLHGLEETLITYSVMHAMVAGSDVVNQAQQRFYLTLPAKEHRQTAMRALAHLSYAPENLLIRLSLYDARFTTHDLLLRSPVGHALQLTYPDGRKVLRNFHDGRLTLQSLPRGLYHVKVETNAGLQMTVPVSISRNQNMQLKVISYADVLGSFLIFALIAALLVTARRPGLRAKIRRRVSSFGKTLRRAEARP